MAANIEIQKKWKHHLENNQMMMNLIVETLYQNLKLNHIKVETT